jgi:cell wall-associated NlpC family hydrolase
VTLRTWRPRLKRVITGLTTVVGGAMLVLGTAGTASAAPGDPAAIEAQIDEQWNQIEPVIEQFNAADAEYKIELAKQQQLANQLRPLEIQVDNAFSRISAMSARYYVSGRTSAFSALLSTGSASTFADQLITLNGIAKQEQLQIKDVLDLKAKYDEQKKPLDALVAKLATQRAELEAKRKSIEGQIAKLQELRLAAYGTGTGTGTFRPVACPQTYDGSKGAKAAQVACSQIGKPYVFNAAGPKTFDCSGITMYAWAAVGVTLRHYTKWQFQDTKRVTRDQLRPGDLVFFFSDMHHMAIYVGNGWVVHAPQSGDVVRMKQLSAGTMPISGYGRPGA